jgi:type IV pilus assembly protein PilO
LASDLSGANIKITNDTDKSIVVNIIDDDKNRPRVKILEENGDISVSRNYNKYSGK